MSGGGILKLKRLWLGLVVLLLLWPATSVLAEGLVRSSGGSTVVFYDEGQIFVGEDVSLEPGETFDGDLGILDGDLTLAEGSTVNGDVFITSGDAYVAGRVNGDLAIISGNLTEIETGWVTGDVFGASSQLDVAGFVGGDLSSLFGGMELRSSAVVKGDLLATPGEYHREDGAQIQGEEVHEFSIPPIPFIRDRLSEVPELRPTPQLSRPTPSGRPLGQDIGRFVGRAVAATFLGLVFIALGALIVIVWPRATHRVSDCIAVLPVQSFGLGLLTYLMAAGLEALAAVLMILIILLGTALIATGILFPIGLLLILLSLLVLLPVPLTLVGAMVLGWVGLAQLIGGKVMKALRVQEPAPLGSALVGLVITVALAAFLWLIQPTCCAWLFVILLTSIGLGAVIHTRFGKQSCRMAGAPDGPELLPLEAMDEESGQPDGPVSPAL